MAIPTFVWFLVSLVASIALAPKPPKPKAAAIEDFELPTAEHDRPLPVLFGTKRITGSNVVWYGDLANTRIKQRSLFSSVTVGFKYYLGIHFELSYGPWDELSQIEVGDKLLWSGSVTSNTNIDVNDPNLFGGDKKEGGMTGRIAVMMGAETQTANAYLASAINSPMPAFRSIFSLVWERGTTEIEVPGFGLFTAQLGYIGNTPYPKPWAITGTRILKGWFNDSVWYAEKAAIGDAMNPAHVMYQCLTDPRFGQGTIAAQINEDSFRTAADRLFDEGFGLNLLWNQSTRVDDFMTIVIEHIGGVLAIDPANNQYVLILFRDDYDAESLDSFGPGEISSMESLQTQSWGETVNELVITYTDPETLKGLPITVQDLANIRNQGGVISERIDRSGITDHDLIAEVGARELAQRSTPLWRARFVINRQFWDKTIGGVFKLDWPRPLVEDVVMRVLKASPGTLEDGSIRVECVQDIYSVQGLDYAISQPAGSGPAPLVTEATGDTNPNVLAADLSGPPSGPNDGDRYLIPLAPPAEGDWIDHEGEIAEWDAQAEQWFFVSVPPGTIIFDEGSGDHLLVDDVGGVTAFNPVASGGHPVPTLTSTSPPSLPVGGSGGVLLTVDGTGFTFWTVATWEGQPLDTQWLSSTQLEVFVPAELLDTPGTFELAVVTPPPGGGTSNVLEVPVVSESWSPALISTTLWLDAADGATFTLDGSDNVSEWRDKSGNDNHMPQTIDTARPARVASGVQFVNVEGTSTNPNTSEYLRRSGNLLTGYPFSVFSVVDAVGPDSIGNGSVFAGTQNNETRYAVQYVGDADDQTHTVHRNTTTRTATASSIWGSGERHILRSLWENSNREIEVDASGTIGTQTSSSADLTAAGDTYVGVERLPDSTWLANGLIATVREIVLIHGAVSIETRQKMEGYLAHKWAIADQLPSGHPYGDEPPPP